MNLIKYNNELGVKKLYINNIELVDFLSFFKDMDIKIEQIIEDAEPRTVTNMDILNELIKNKLNITYLKLNIQNNISAEINDCYEYNICASQIYLETILQYLLGCKQIDDVLKKVIEGDGSYFLIEKCNIIKVFENFEQYWHFATQTNSAP